MQKLLLLYHGNEIANNPGKLEFIPEISLLIIVISVVPQNFTEGYLLFKNRMN